MTAWERLKAAAWFRRSVRTFLQAFLALLVPGALGWLNDLTDWSRNQGQSPFPDAHSLAYLGVTAITAGVIAAVTAVWNGTEDLAGHGLLRTVTPSSDRTQGGRASLLLAAAVAITFGVVGAFVAASPAQAAGWTNNGCKTISGTDGDAAVVCLNFYTLQSGNQYLLTSVKVCMSTPSQYNANQDSHNNTVSIRGSGGAGLGSVGVPTVPRNGCSSSATNIRGGAGMQGTLYGTINVNPLPPFYRPDVDYQMCRGVVTSGGC